jgi:integrase
MGTHGGHTGKMATLRMTSPWKDPRTGVFYLKKRIPKLLRAVSGHRGETIKISTGTADRQECLRRWPGVLHRYADLEAEWRRKLNVVILTSDTGAEVAAKWAAWVATQGGLTTDGRGSDLFEPLDLPEERTPERVAAMWDVIEGHADEAARVAGVEISPETRPLLVQRMTRVVQAAYLDADLRNVGVSGPPVVHPLDAVRRELPPVAEAPGPKTDTPVVSFADLLGGWKRVAVVKPRTVTETGYVLDLLAEHLEHHDAARVSRDDLAAWRDAAKADGLTNNTWNNRLSLVRQVFAWGVTEAKLKVNPAETSLRLRKNRTATRLPYSDGEVVAILTAARLETRASLRWAPWIMAFSGMRVAEVLQLAAADVREERDVPFLAIHEDDPDKSVKTGERRNVPIHPALVAEGFLDYARSVPQDGPLFPDKGLDVHGNRGGRGWNVTGKWVREVVKITDPQKAPNHSFRHRLEDELRAVEVPEDVRDAILGHARKTTGRLYGVRGEGLRRLHRALSEVPVPDGLHVPVA